jgi:16S rRNA (cytidine1402-2'-O)-methyltransferase
LTKKFEEIRRGYLSELGDNYTQAGTPKGEVTIVVAPPTVSKTKAPPKEIDRLLKNALASASLKDAVSSVVAATGASKRDVYARALELDTRCK